MKTHASRRRNNVSRSRPPLAQACSIVFPPPAPIASAEWSVAFYDGTQIVLNVTHPDNSAVIARYNQLTNETSGQTSTAASVGLGSVTFAIPSGGTIGDEITVGPLALFSTQPTLITPAPGSATLA